MLVQLSKAFAVITVASVLCLGAFGQAQQPKRNWKDRAEYDLYESILKEKNPTKKLELINTWKSKYPKTDFEQERFLATVDAYRGLNQGAKIVDVAKERLTEDPKDFTALYWIAFLTPVLPSPSAEAQDEAVKAANGMIANIDAQKPPQASDADWTKAKNDLLALAHTTIGWVELQRKNNEAAEKELRQALELSPNLNSGGIDLGAQISFFLGSAIIGQKQVERYPQALFQFARAASMEGPGSIPAAQRQTAISYLDKVYTTFHGDKSGLEELKTLARQSTFAPPDLKIKSAYEVAAEKEAEFRKSNPQLALWMSIKKELTGPEGEKYFAEKMKDAALPPLKGKIISATPAARPKEIVLGLADATTPEVTLKVDSPMPGKADPGTEIEFEGIPTAFSRDPFMVTIDVEKDKITGWPAPPPPAKKAVRRGGARKKK